MTDNQDETPTQESSSPDVQAAADQMVQDVLAQARASLAQEAGVSPDQALVPVNPLSLVQAGMVADSALQTGTQDPLTVDLVPSLPPLPDQHLAGDLYDERLWKRVQNGFPDLKESIKTAGESTEWNKQLSLDVFRSLYFMEPDLQDVREEYQTVAQALDETFKTSEYQEMHALTQLDPINAGMGAMSYIEALSKAIGEEEKRQQETQEGDGEGEGEGQPGQGGIPGGGFGQAVRQAARKAAQQALQTINETQQALDTFSGGKNPLGQGWGLGAGSENLSGNIQNRIQLAKKVRNNERLRRIARLCGRMLSIADAAQKRKTNRPVSEVYRVGKGKSLERVIAADRTLLAHPLSRKLMLRKFLESDLRVYDLRATEKVGRGPIIVTIDESGSMDGLPIDWAMALVLTLLSLASAQKRDLRVIHYGSRQELLVEDYPKGQGTPDQVMKTCLHFFGGGTEYEPWMQKALEAINESQYAKADVIHISDGICGISDQFKQTWMETKKAKDFRVQTIMVATGYRGSYGYSYQHELDFLRSFSDDVTVIDTNKLESGDRDLLDQTLSL